MENLFKLNKLFLALVVFGTSTATIHASSITFATWTDTQNGSLNGVDFTVSGAPTGSIGQADFGTEDGRWGTSPGILHYLPYRSENNLTITFNSAISNLSLYTYYWRGSAVYGGVQTLSEHFTANASYSETASGTTVSGSGYNSGILSFSGPVTTLSITGAGSSSWQGLTFAVPANVPDTGSTAALLGVGVVALAYARRKLG